MSVLWDGRFEKPASTELWTYSTSKTDRRLLVHDVTGSLAHMGMLMHTYVISQEEGSKITMGLGQILEDAQAGNFQFLDSDEDVHSAVERRLGEIIGELAGKLHTGRSRNDQIALDLKLYLRDAGHSRIRQIHQMIDVLITRADEHQDKTIAAYTHMQQAQAVPLSQHLLAYAWMLVRDAQRFQDLLKRMDFSPLGAGAVGGSSLPLDSSWTAAHLGFSKAFDNSMDAVASRDFVSEFSFCVAQTMVHLSRLSEDVILWNTKEFGWATLPDELATGSSMLPQKKNPDIAELARGKTGNTIGYLVSLLTLQKALPLSYNRDLQEDKESIFSADDTLGATLPAMAALMTGIKFHPKLPDSSVLAIDLAEKLVERGVPFRQAHRAVGKIVSLADKTNRNLNQLTIAELTNAHESFEPGDLDLLEPEISVKRRRTDGGGSISSIQIQIHNLQTLLKGNYDNEEI